MSQILPRNEPANIKMKLASFINYYQQATPGHPISDKELARRSGVSLVTIMHIKDPSFPSLPRLSTVVKIANGLHIPFDCIL